MTSKLSFQMLPNPVGQRAGSGGMCHLLAKVGSMLYHSNYIAKIVYFFRTLGKKKREEWVLAESGVTLGAIAMACMKNGCEERK